MLHREALTDLKYWKNSQTRKPLILMGARQVGKTFLVKEFAKDEYENLLYLNFESQKDLCDLFSENLDPKKLIQIISAYKNQKWNPHTTLCFFDEIQACPSAITALKYFQEEEPQYHIISAGSLLGVRLAKAQSFPVGKVEFLDLASLNFREFLLALGESALLDMLIGNKEKLVEPLHKKLCEILKLYTYVGGMPEAVSEYATTRNFEKVREIQENINRSYLLDFSKYADPAMAVRISEVWASLPAQLARESKKFLFSVIKQSARGREYGDAVQWLIDAGLVIKVRQTSTPKLPLDVYAKNDVYKLYVHDTGLLSAMLGLSERMVLLEPKLMSEFNGALAENLACQQVRQCHLGTLCYWVSAGMAEVDFLFSLNGEIYPLEVKSGMNVSQRSLALYSKMYSPKQSLRTSLRNYDRKDNFMNIPLYALGEMRKILG